VTRAPLGRPGPPPRGRGRPTGSRPPGLRSGPGAARGRGWPGGGRHAQPPELQVLEEQAVDRGDGPWEGPLPPVGPRVLEVVRLADEVHDRPSVEGQARVEEHVPLALERARDQGDVDDRPAEAPLEEHRERRLARRQAGDEERVAERVQVTGLPVDRVAMAAAVGPVVEGDARTVEAPARGDVLLARPLDVEVGDGETPERRARAGPEEAAPGHEAQRSGQLEEPPGGHDAGVEQGQSQRGPAPAEAGGAREACGPQGHEPEAELRRPPASEPPPGLEGAPAGRDEPGRREERQRAGEGRGPPTPARVGVDRSLLLHPPAMLTRRLAVLAAAGLSSGRAGSGPRRGGGRRGSRASARCSTGARRPGS